MIDLEETFSTPPMHVISTNAETWSGNEMLDRVRSFLQARAEGINMGGDIEVMKAVDKIVQNEACAVNVHPAYKLGDHDKRLEKRLPKFGSGPEGPFGA